MTAETLDNLNRLLALLRRSFPQYLRYSRPYVPPGASGGMETFESIAADQEALADRVSRMVYDGGALPNTGEFPIEFTDMHDLAIDFLIKASVFYQEQDVQSISQLVDALQTAPAAKSIAEEALGLAKGHLDSLRELQLPSAAS